MVNILIIQQLVKKTAASIFFLRYCFVFVKGKNHKKTDFINPKLTNLKNISKSPQEIHKFASKLTDRLNIALFFTPKMTYVYDSHNILIHCKYSKQD